jgi:hypothetical protein
MRSEHRSKCGEQCPHLGRLYKHFGLPPPRRRGKLVVPVQVFDKSLLVQF